MPSLAMHRSPARKLQYVGAMAVAGVLKGSRVLWVKAQDDRQDNCARMPARNDHSELCLWREGKSAGLSSEMYTSTRSTCMSMSKRQTWRNSAIRSRKHFCPSLLALYLNAPHSNKIAQQRDQREWVRAGGQEGNSKPCQRNLPPGCPSSSRWRTACPLAKELDDGGVVAKQQDVMSLEVRLSGQQTAVNSPQFLEVDVQREQVRVQESGFVGARAPEGYGDLHPRVMV
jgi:hypothetical protein